MTCAVALLGLPTDINSSHLRGPAKSAQRDVAVIDPDGLFEHLSQGG